MSCTLETGTYLVYDIRQGLQQAVFSATMGKSVSSMFSLVLPFWSTQDLQAHAWYTGQNVIMGFGDGELHHIDMRVSDRM